MTNTFATQQPNTANLISHTFLVVRCLMLLSSPLSFTTPASATPFPHLQLRKTHGVSTLVKEAHLEQRGSHGAWNLVNQ